MGTGELRFFTTIETLAPILSEIGREYEFECVLDVITFKKNPSAVITDYHKIEIADIYEQCKKLQPYQLFFSQNKKMYKKLLSDGLHPAKLGIIITGLPQLVNNKLCMSRVCVKTGWYDSKDRPHENEDLKLLYRKVRARVRKRLSFPVLIYRLPEESKSEASICKGLGYTPCVRELTKTGCELVQSVQFKNNSAMRYCLEETE